MLVLLEKASAGEALSQFTGNVLHYFGQYAAHNSVLTIHLVDQKVLKSAPLNSLLFLASYPIPRKLWEGKPEILGILIVHEVLHLPYQTNWGIGIVGTTYHEGGFLTTMLYAFLAVVGVRLIDDNIQRHPDNMFLLAILCSARPTSLPGCAANPC